MLANQLLHQLTLPQILIILGPEQQLKGPNPNDGEESHITLQREFGPMLNESWYYTKTPPVATNETSDEDKLEQSTSSRSPCTD